MWLFTVFMLFVEVFACTSAANRRLIVLSQFCRRFRLYFEPLSKIYAFFQQANFDIQSFVSGDVSEAPSFMK